ALLCPIFFLTIPRPPPPTLFPYTTLFRSLFSNGSSRRPRRRTTSSRTFRAAACSSCNFCWIARKRSDFMAVLTLSPASLLMRFRSEEHTSELQSRRDLVCRLLLEKKKRKR